MRQFLNKELNIGNKTIKNRLVFASMSKLGNIAFRELLEGFGGYGLLFSEMSSAKAIPSENPAVSQIFKWRDQEKKNLVWQLLGSDPKIMATAACRIEKEGFFGVDINFSCSASRILKQGIGAAVLKDPDLAVEIASSIRKNVDIPIFVKFRTGWRDDPEPATILAKKFEEAGVDALTFHPRVAPDRRTRPPKWDYIRRVKEAVKIPVFGNGNVFTYEDCKKIINTTGCDGVALGRIAICCPWVFDKWLGNKEIDYELYLNTVEKYIGLLLKHFNEQIAIKRFKKFAFYYCAGFRYGHTLYTRLIKCKSLDESLKIAQDFFSTRPERSMSPNENLFV